MSPADGRTAGITKFLQTSLYDPFLVVLFTKVLSLLKSLHNIPGSGLLSLNIVSTRAECWTGSGHQSPSLAISFHCSRILRRGFLTHRLHLCLACGRRGPPMMRPWHGFEHWLLRDCDWRKGCAWPRWNERRNCILCQIRERFITCPSHCLHVTIFQLNVFNLMFKVQKNGKSSFSVILYLCWTGLPAAA